MKIWGAVLGSLVLLTGCGGIESQAVDRTSTSAIKSYPYKAVATVGMVADIVQNVAGDRGKVQRLLGSGVDPHLYKATRDDVQSIISGDIVFYSGLMLEGKMADTLIKVSRNKPVYAVTELLDEKSLLEPDDFQGHYDPHVWMDVSLWSQCATVVAQSLSEFDPANAELYSANATNYRDRLAKLHDYGKTCIASIPESSRVLITSHDAFNYLGRAYGLEVIGVQGISTESEAGLQQVNGLVDLIVSRKVSAVFVESSVSQKNLLAIVDGARSRGHELKIGGELFSDAMGAEGTYEGTYEGMLDHNITLVTRGLGGTAPEKGLNGKLSQSHP
jgi:manganese/zinc/iron transport system substrate-binding protein